MQKPKVYLAGPMRGLPYFNYPAFRRAAAKLRAKGFYVFNPAEADTARTGVDASMTENGKTGTLGDFDLRTALAEDMDFICREADAIALLPGWQKSMGATAEKATADALGLCVIYLNDDYEISGFVNADRGGVQLDLFFDKPDKIQTETADA